jgi:hypothetical protein
MTFDAERIASAAMIAMADPSNRETDWEALAGPLREAAEATSRAAIAWAHWARFVSLADADMEHAERALEVWVERRMEVGAGAILLIELRHPWETSYVPEWHLLNLSVEASPNWAVNHLNLAWAFERTGDLPAARASARRARQNLLPPSAAPVGVERAYELMYTGRLMPAASVDEYLERLGQD